MLPASPLEIFAGLNASPQSVAVAVAVFVVGLAVLFVVHKVKMDIESEWFVSVVFAGDEDLAARGTTGLIRDCVRMEEIALDVNNRAGVNKSWINADAVKGQLVRLNTALIANRR